MKPLALLLAFLALTATLAAQDLSSVLRSYSGTPEQNAFLWRNLDALRKQPNVPRNVVEGLNSYRVATVRATREAVVRDMMRTGQYSDKALAGFINTGTWSDPAKAKDPAQFKLKSDVDFTAVGRDPKAVKEFQQRFYSKLGDHVGVPPNRVIKTLDVNCYSLGGTEPGAYRTPGGRRFFEVYSSKGGYDAITGSGANATVRRTNIDNAFIDLGKKTPRFTPGDSAMFVGELRDQMLANTKAYRGVAAKEAQANAKLVERVAYANAVSEGKVLGEGAARVVQEAQALRAGRSMEQALAGRIDDLVRTGMSRQQAVQNATRQFVNETRNYVQNSATRLGNAAVQAERAELVQTETMLAKLSGGKIAAGTLRAGMGAMTLYMLHDAYKRDGNAGLAKELVKQGLYHSFPPTVLAELAGIGVRAGGQAIVDYANECKTNAVLNSMFGGTPEGLMDFYKNYRNPEKLRAYIEREWKEQDQFTGAYFGKGLSNAEVKELIFDQARAMMLEVTSRLREEKQKDERILRELREMVRKDEAREKAENEDKELTADLREMQKEEMEEFREKEVAQAEKDKEKDAETAAQEGTGAEESLWSRITGRGHKTEPETAERETAGRDRKAQRNGEEDEVEKPAEEPPVANATPALFRTSWRGNIAIQVSGEETVGGSVSLPIQFTIDNANRIAGTCRFPAVAGMGFQDDPGLREVALAGSYDSRTGRIDIAMSHVQNSKPIGEHAGVPIVEESRLKGKIAGVPESGDVLTGDIRATITVSHMPGRAYTADEIMAWARTWWRSNRPNDAANNERINQTAREAIEVLNQRDPYDAPIEATWRAERVR